MNVGIGDDITINGRVVQLNEAMNEVLILTSSRHYHWVHVEDINTLHPYREPSTEDMREGN